MFWDTEPMIAELRLLTPVLEGKDKKGDSTWTDMQPVLQYRNFRNGEWKNVEKAYIDVKA